MTKTEETVFGSSNKVLSSKSELLGSLSRSSSYNSEMTVFVAESQSNEAISLNPIALILQECLLSHYSDSRSLLGEKRVDCECSEPISSSEASLLLGELKRAERELIDCKPKNSKFERREPLASEAR